MAMRFFLGIELIVGHTDEIDSSHRQGTPKAKPKCRNDRRHDCFGRTRLGGAIGWTFQIASILFSFNSNHFDCVVEF